MSEGPWLAGWRLTLARALALAAVIAITALVFVYRERAQELSEYGYPGIFLISVIANATVILPVPGVALTFTMGSVFHPAAVALAAGAGATIGELTGYLTGFSGGGIIPKGATYERFEAWIQRFGGWFILVLAAIPNPLFDIGGAIAGALKMPVYEFLLWAWIGKTIKMLAFAYAGAYSIEWLMHLFQAVP